MWRVAPGLRSPPAKRCPCRGTTVAVPGLALVVARLGVGLVVAFVELDVTLPTAAPSIPLPAPLPEPPVEALGAGDADADTPAIVRSAATAVAGASLQRVGEW